MESIQQKGSVLSCTAFPRCPEMFFRHSIVRCFPNEMPNGQTYGRGAEIQREAARPCDRGCRLSHDQVDLRGPELPAYEAASEFTAKIGAQLDNLLPELGGKNGALKTLEKPQAARNQAQQKLTELLKQMRDSQQNPTAGAGGDRRGESGREQNAAG